MFSTISSSQNTVGSEQQIKIAYSSPPKQQEITTKDEDKDILVRISNEAKDKLLNDKSGKAGGAESSSKSSFAEMLDRAIEIIQEQIKIIQEKLAELKGDDSEAAEDMRRELTGQLLQLYGELVQLIEKKMELAKHAKQIEGI